MQLLRDATLPHVKLAGLLFERVVGVKGATRAFESGDVVRLDGAEGTIERL